MKFVAFCDYGENVGLGHLKRCEKLLALLTDLCSCEYSIIKNATTTDITALKEEHLSGIIIDSYIFTSVQYNLLASLSVPLLCFDDENRAVYPAGSFVLNGAPNAHLLYPKSKEAQILTLVQNIRESSGVYYLLGLPYALISSHFRAKSLHKKQIYDIFINFGGADSKNFSAQVLEYIPRHYHIHLVLGELYSHTLEPKENVTLYHNLTASELNALMISCDVAISAGGGMLLELAQSQVPSIMFASAPNQSFQIAQFAALGAFLQAQSLHQIPALIQSLNPLALRKAKADILAKLPLGGDLIPALKAIFKL